MGCQFCSSCHPRVLEIQLNSSGLCRKYPYLLSYLASPRTALKILNYIYLFVCLFIYLVCVFSVCVCGNSVCAMEHMWRSESLLPWGFWGLNVGHQIWQQVPRPLIGQEPILLCIGFFSYLNYFHSKTTQQKTAGGGGDGSAVQSTCCSCRGPGSYLGG